VFSVDQNTLFTSQSMAADFTSPLWDVKGMFTGCIELAWTGVNSATCSFKLQGSGTGAIWCDIRDAENLITATGTGDAIIELPFPRGFSYVRVLFTAGSNTAGSMTAVTVNKYDRSGDFPGRGI